MASVTGITAARMLEIEAATIVGASVDANGDLILTKQDNTTINAGNAYEVLGFHPSSGETPPASSVDANGVPILWVSGGSLLDPVLAIPTPPTWDLGARTVTIPTVTGVQYVLADGANIVPLAAGVNNLSGYTRPYTAVVKAIAKPGYSLLTTYSWSALFADASLMTLYASDTFAGTPNAVLGGRTWDMAGGGSGTPPVWSNAGPVNRLAIASNGAAASMNLAEASQRWGGAGFYPGVDNFAVEVDISKDIPAHSRTFGISVGNSVKLGITCESGQAWQWEVTAGNVSPAFTRITPTFKTSATEAQVLGTWRWNFVGRVMQLIAPDAQQYTMDWNPYTPSGWSWSNPPILFSVTDFNAGCTTENCWPWADAIRLYR